MIDVSIVSGTFNRITYLQNMVESVRQSFATVHGVSHEIVLVDGGSEDGTLEWCKQQPDIRVIEHGRLLGAIKAFNDGAFAAQGRYVVLANDDIEFLGDGLPRAWAFMQAHPEAGMGCFFQDRSVEGKPPDRWHVESQNCVVADPHHRRVFLPYGQVAIVPKALGDSVGWWGDYLHTYGGDNELSSQVYESGYKVFPLYFGDTPGPVVRVGPDEEGDICAIHDCRANDALRTLNNEGRMGADPRSHRGHPDSWTYGRRWTQQRWQSENQRRNKRDLLSGPFVSDAPQFSISFQAGERFVYLPIYEPGWDVQKQQKRGLREALVRIGTVAEVDYVGEGEPLQAAAAACKRIQPTVVLCQLHNATPIGPDGIAFLRKQCADDCWFANWNGDYWPENLTSDEGIALARAFDVQLTVNRAVLEEYWRLGVNARYWQIGWEPDGRGYEPGPEDRCDVVFLGNGYSRERQKLGRQLKTLPYSLRLWGNGWPDGWAVGQCTYDFITACRAYRGARFSIGDSQWPESGFVSNRVMQALAAGGAALCHQWFKDMELLGLVDGQTCIVWRNFEDLANKLDHYAAHEDERVRIAEAGERLAVERHSFDVRVSELMQFRPGAMEDWR